MCPLLETCQPLVSRLLLSATVFDVISAGLKWLPPPFLQGFIITVEVGPKRALASELITSRHPGRDLYSKAQ